MQITKFSNEVRPYRDMHRLGTGLFNSQNSSIISRMCGWNSDNVKINITIETLFQSYVKSVPKFQEPYLPFPNGFLMQILTGPWKP